MADHAVIYDPELEMAALIDAETMRALGPIGAGPHAREEMLQFIDRMPAVVLEGLSTFELNVAYAQFWEANFAGLYAAEGEGATPAPEPVGGTGGDAAALAEHEARAAGGEPPPPAPADADTDADQGAADTVGGGNGAVPPPESPPTTDTQPYEGECFACGGTGTVPGSAPGETAQCNLCKGTGRITARVTA